MSVWLCIPSARPPEEAERVLKLWRERGYKIALWLNPLPVPHIFAGMIPAGGYSNWETKLPPLPGKCDFVVVNDYRGYATSVNALIAEIIERDPQAEWFVTGGDDVEPDPNHTAEEIARQCNEHFIEQFELECHEADYACVGGPQQATFGVMQPTGDRFAEGSIDRICGSPWMGREFCRRINQGKGPLWPEYTRFFVDEELQNVAIKYGVFWQRRDLVHLHRWYGRASDALDSGTAPNPEPAHLVHQNVRWEPEKAIFNQRRAEGFPGSGPIA